MSSVSRLITLDFETYWAADYSLRSMPTQAYVLDPRFEPILLSWQDHAVDPEPRWVPKPEIPELLAGIDWSTTAVVCHNARFDVSILTWRYGKIPAFIFDTMAMAQPTIYPVTGSASLETVARYLNLGAKGDEVHQAKGKPYSAFTPDELRRYAEYSMLDTALTTRVFKVLGRVVPASEMMVIDTAVRMFTEPQLVYDADILAEHLSSVRAGLQRLLVDAGLEDRAKLMSDADFADMLRNHGVEPAMKPGARGLTYAFAKTDPQMRDLLEHDDPMVRVLVAARLGHKSTIEVTRAQSFLNLSMIDWGAATAGVCRGVGHAPVPLRYYAAHPGRFGGADKLNWQNLPRGGALRRAARAPKGRAVVAIDASQIECRINAYIAGEDKLLEVFKSGGDPYCAFASLHYKRPITRADKTERHLGKTAILGLGYGMGRYKFVFTCANAKPSLKIDMLTSAGVVDLYRSVYNRIPQLWRASEQLLLAIVQGQPLRLGPVETCKDGILLPNGMRISYPMLSYSNREWTYRYGKETRRLFGPKVTENIVQALARIVMTDAMTRMREWGWRAAHTNHDELVYVVPESEAQDCLAAGIEALSTPPAWAPGIPLAAEGGIGPSWGEAK